MLDTYAGGLIAGASTFCPRARSSSATLRPVIPTRRSAALALSAALLVAGCSNSESDADTEAESPPASSQPSASADERSSDRPPDGMQWVVTDSGLRFAVPKTWTVVPGTDVSDQKYDAAVEDYADAVSSSADKVRSSLRSTDVIVVGKKTGILAGTSDDDEVPSEDELRSSLAGRGFYAKTDDLTTAVGPGRIANVVGEFDGVRLYAALLYLPIGDGVTTLAVTDRSREDVAYQVSLVLASIGEVS